MEKENAVRILKSVATPLVQDFIHYLCCRWADEKAYEDFAEYVKAVEKELGLPVVKSSKRPFSFTVVKDGVSITIKATTRKVDISASWK